MKEARQMKETRECVETIWRWNKAVEELNALITTGYQWLSIKFFINLIILAQARNALCFC